MHKSTNSKIENGREGKETKLVATLYTPAELPAGLEFLEPPPESEPDLPGVVIIIVML